MTIRNEERRSMKMSKLDSSTSNAPSHPTNETVADDEHMTFIQAVRRWPMLTAYSLGLASTILLVGYDLVVVGTVASMPAFQKAYGKWFEDDYIIPASWLALWNASTPLGHMAGSVIGGWSQDRVGRRLTLATASFLSAIAVAVCYVSDLGSDVGTRRAVFFVGKVFQGFAMGAALCTTQTYMSEVLPHQMRGPTMAFFTVFKLVGQLIGAGVVRAQIEKPSATAYRACFASQWPFSLVPFLLAIVIPESPVLLIRRNNIDAARKSHLKLAGSSGLAQAEKTFETLREAVYHEQEASNSLKSTYIQCFQGTDRRRTLIVAFANCIPYLFGLTLFGSASYFMQTLGLKPNTSVTLLLVGLSLGLVANVGSFYTLTRFSRRRLSISTWSVALVLWAGMGISGSFSGDGVMWYAGATFIINISVLSLGVWPASFAISAEASSLRLRAKTQGIGWFVHGVFLCIFGIFLPYLYNEDQAALGAKTGWVFAACSALGVGTLFFFVPEMKDRTPKEVDEMFQSKLKTREFKAWRSQ